MELHGQTNVPVELALLSAETYGEIFLEVDVDVHFTGPEGQQWQVPAFWTGENEFRVRFAAPDPGEYTWRSTCSNPDDSGLGGSEGQLVITPYMGDVELFRHGRLRTAANRRTLEHRDGTPFFWLGDTWWMGLTTRLKWPEEFRELALDRMRKGFNLIQIVCGPLPDFDAASASWHPQQANEGGFSWEEGWARINPAFYEFADLRLEYLIRHGLMPCIVGMWGFYLPWMSLNNVRRHWRYLVARYGAYPVVWCLAGEVNMLTYSLHAGFRSDGRHSPDFSVHRALQEESWTEIARYVKDLDPFANILTAHPSSPDSRAMLHDEEPLDLDMLQTGHGGYYSMARTVELTRNAVELKPPMPVVNGEPSYEGIMGGSKDEVQRFLFWASISCGACGHTYGAQGIWAMSSRDEPFVGTTNSWGEGFFQDVMHYPGSLHVGIGRRFFLRYPWWRLRPREEPLLPENRTNAFALGIPEELAIYYLPPMCVDSPLLGMHGARGIAIEPGACYTAHFFNPRGGENIPIGKVAADEQGFWPMPKRPGMDDWVLVLENREMREKSGSWQQ